ncbi:DNA mismatch repair protein Msh2 [Trichoplax sp. H2]|nr:DNA mismatch repair protein Msh2 [Trichoplax sp. H2]|eukprot:RDD41891.1 DNA mismatch repair protein Msh2 [Trichoplax sp. H2]
MASSSTQQLTLDGTNQNGFRRFLDSLPEKLETTIRIFDRSDWFTVHGSDAIFVANNIFRSKSVIRYYRNGNEKLEYVVLNNANYEKVLRDLLLVRQYRIELYKNKGTKTNQQWYLAEKATPGNLRCFEEIIFGNNEMSESAPVIAIRLVVENGQRIIGVAYADATLYNLGISQFEDNDLMTNLEALMVQIGPKECILVSGETSVDAVKLRQVINKTGVLVTERKKSDFNDKDIVQDLNRLLRIKSGNAATLAEIDQQVAMSCVTALIKYLELLSNVSNFNQFDLVTFDLSQFMKLDSAAVRALNLFPSPSDAGNKLRCLMGVLNYCKTAPGQRLLAQWLKQPLMDIAKIEERLNLVDVFVDDTELRQSVQEDHLKRFPDLQRLAKKFQRSRANLQDCVRVYQSINRVNCLIKALVGYDSAYKDLIRNMYSNPLSDLTTDFQKYQELIETTVDLDSVANHEFVIKPSIDPDLQEYRNQMDDLIEQISRLLSLAARDLGLEANKSIKLESNSQFGYYFRVTLKEEKALRSNKRFMMIDTNKHGVRFTNNNLESLNKSLQEIKSMYDGKQEDFAVEVINIASGYYEPLQSLSRIIAHLDVIVSFAHASANAPVPYVRPTILDTSDRIIELTEARHPCLEMQDDVAFIPNDVKFAKDDAEFIIITGPNMGGKSTYIRQIGVIVLMAQIGCFVPCSFARISIIDCILARVGAGDSQLKGVSTFMSEMLETSYILKTATEKSLIIIDELGRGTSTYDGFGLAWAISESIAKDIGAFTLFATHFHELTALANDIKSVKNFHVSAMTTEEALTLLYRVKPGVCDQSFGIHVAELAHFPENVVTHAKERAADLENCQAISYVTESDSDRRRDIMEEGEGLIHDFLQKISQISTTERSPQEVYSEIAMLRNSLSSCSNSYIKDLVSHTASQA